MSDVRRCTWPIVTPGSIGRPLRCRGSMEPCGPPLARSVLIPRCYLAASVAAMAPLSLSREQILAFRRRVGALDERLPAGEASLRRAAWAGLQDSMPRAAVLSLHARVDGTEHTSWEHPSLVQLWGPRYQVYVVSADDVAPFSLGRFPEDAKGRRRAEHAADTLEALLRGEKMPYGQAGQGLGVNANSLRYGATTGRVLIRWEGARAPAVWTVPAPDVSPHDAQLELARRYLHVFGPSTAASFAKW